ncbi:Uncharacterized protein Fot_49099 [Forsythia ovata]|uniref:Uncharacterized protein n=1 Tax=Forsythia ovata TaxID=205694 RepID=A0ABD1QCP2_9LAMI
MGEMQSSPDRDEEVTQRPTVALFPPASTSKPAKLPFGRALPKAKSRKKQGPAPTEMRGSLYQRGVPSACQLDDELTSSTNAAVVVQSKIRDADMEVLRLAYDIPVSIHLHAPNLMNEPTILLVKWSFTNRRCNRGFVKIAPFLVLEIEKSNESFYKHFGSPKSTH